MNPSQVKSIVKETVVKSISTFAKNSLSNSKKAKFQILDLLIPNERKVRSIVGGLETSQGTTLWEPLAKALAQENGFTIIDDKLLCPVNMPSNLNNALQSIIDDRKKDAGSYSAKSSHDEIKRVCQSFINRPIDSFEKPAKGRGVDIWLYKDGINYFFDTKTVQPNLSALIGCLEQLLSWYAFFYSRYPDKQAVARIVFPYNPNSGKSFWNGVIGGGKPLEPDNEGWVENQFWDFCSGEENTFALIKESFTELRESGKLEATLNNLLRS